MTRIIGIAAALAAASAFAHGGGLNSEGCHNNRKTGDYHCHRAPAPSPRPKAQPEKDAPAEKVKPSRGKKSAPKASGSFDL